MVAAPNLLADNSDGSSLVKQYFSLAELVQDLVTTTEIYSPSVYGCAYNIDPVCKENDGV